MKPHIQINSLLWSQCSPLLEDLTDSQISPRVRNHLTDQLHTTGYYSVGDTLEFKLKDFLAGEEMKE